MYPQESPNIEADIIHPAEPATPSLQDIEAPKAKDKDIHDGHGEQEETATKPTPRPWHPDSVSRSLYSKMQHLYHFPKSDETARSKGEHLARLLLLRSDIPARYRVRAHMVLACGPVDYLWHARRAVAYAEREMVLFGGGQSAACEEAKELLEQARRALGRAEEDWIAERCDFQLGNQGDGGKEEDGFRCTRDGEDYTCDQVMDMEVEQGERQDEGIEGKLEEDEKTAEKAEMETEGMRGDRSWRSRLRRLRMFKSD